MTPIPVHPRSANVVPHGDKRSGNWLGIRNVIAENTRVDGVVEIDQSVIVNGAISGGVLATADNLIVLLKETSKVGGAVRASTVMIAGEVRGDVHAEVARLFPTARVYGKLFVRKLAVDAGAVILNSGMLVGEVQAETAEVTAPKPALSAA